MKEQDVERAVKIATDVHGDDFELATRLCADAPKGRLREMKRLLGRCVERVRGNARVRSSYLPFLRLFLGFVAKNGADDQRRICREWANGVFGGKHGQPSTTPCVSSLKRSGQPSRRCPGAC